MKKLIPLLVSLCALVGSSMPAAAQAIRDGNVASVNTGTATTWTLSQLTTVGSNDTILLFVSCNSCGFVKIQDSNHALTFHKRAINSTGAIMWWATTTQPLTNDVISITYTGGNAGTAVAIAFTGTANTSVFSPMDANGALPSIPAANTGPTFTTSTATDVLVAFCQMSVANPTAGTDGLGAWTTAFGANNILLEYIGVTSTQSAHAAPFGSGTVLGRCVGDAVINSFYADVNWADGRPTYNYLGVNVGDSSTAGITYYSSEIPFLNAWKQSTGWTTQDAGNNDVGQEHCVPLDGDGYATSLTTSNGSPGCGTLNYTKLRSFVFLNGCCAIYPADTYDITWDGTGNTIQVTGDGGTLNCSSGATNACPYVVTTPAGGGIFITITTINPADHLRNLAVVPHTYQALYASGERLHPNFKNAMAPFCMVRFMDWLWTGQNTPYFRNFADVARPTSYNTYALTSSTPWTTGKWSWSLQTIASAAAGTNVLTFASLPAWAQHINTPVVDGTANVIPNSTVASGITLITAVNPAAGTVTLSQNITGAGVGNGDWIGFGATTFGAGTITHHPNNVPGIAVLVSVVNELGTDLYLNIQNGASIGPSESSDPYVDQIASYTLANLNPNAHVVLELGNEYWNGWSAFATLFAQNLWGGGASYPDWIGYRSALVCQTFKTIWGAQAGRVTCTMPGQFTNTAVVGGALNCANAIVNGSTNPMYRGPPCARNYGIDVINDAPYWGYHVPDAWAMLDNQFSVGATFSTNTSANCNPGLYGCYSVMNVSSTAGTIGLGTTINVPGSGLVTVAYNATNNGACSGVSCTGTGGTGTYSVQGPLLNTSGSYTAGSCGTQCLNNFFQQANSGNVALPSQTVTTQTSTQVTTASEAAGLGNRTLTFTSLPTSWQTTGYVIADLTNPTAIPAGAVVANYNAGLGTLTLNVDVASPGVGLGDTIAVGRLSGIDSTQIPLGGCCGAGTVISGDPCITTAGTYLSGIDAYNMYGVNAYTSSVVTCAAGSHTFNFAWSAAQSSGMLGASGMTSDYNFASASGLNPTNYLGPALGVVMYEGGQQISEVDQTSIALGRAAFIDSRMTTAYQTQYSNIFAVGPIGGNHYDLTNSWFGLISTVYTGLPNNYTNPTASPRYAGAYDVAAAVRKNLLGYPCGPPRYGRRGSGL
jgi:hypothetical protein